MDPPQSVGEPARKRSRIACVSCQSRKRKCSGQQPCATCCQFGVDCHYDLLSRKKKDTRTLRPQNTTSPLDEPSKALPQQHHGQTVPSTSDDGTRLSSLEANSGAAFVRRLRLKIDPANAPRLHMLAWNVGARHPPPPTMPSANPPTAIPIVELISQDEMRALVAVFFEKVDPCYGFLDRDILLRQVSRRWLQPIASTTAESALPYGPYDAVLCGVAAFGHLFTHRQAHPTEFQLVETARLILEQAMLAETSSVDTVTACVLRTAYLRMTSSPHAAWLSSCSLMHLIEATGLHLEQPDDTTTTTTTQPPPDLRRRLFSLARHLNIWISFELGRSRVILPNATCLSPTPRPTDYTTEIFNLLPVSESLDPNNKQAQESPALESALATVLNDLHLQPPLILAQCNLMLTIYRRLRALNSAIPTTLLDGVLELAGRGLRATREMIAANCPWHQVANVPFQVVCTLLAIDTRAALGLLGDAMRTLREVACAYDTEVMREAYSSAYLLIVLHQQRKEEDTRALKDVLRVNSAAAQASPTVQVGSKRAREEEVEAGGGFAGESTHSLADYPGFSWLSDILIDLPGVQNLDPDNFLGSGGLS